MTLQHPSILAWHHDVKVAHRPVPLPELTLRPRAPRETSVLLHEPAQHITLSEIGDVHQIDEPGIALPADIAGVVEHERQTAAHSRPEVAASAAEHDDSATG